MASTTVSVVTTSKFSLLGLPSDVWISILSSFSTRDLLDFGLISKDCYNLSHDEYLWNLLCVKTWRQLQLDDIENPESIGEEAWKQAYINISTSFPIKFTVTKLSSGMGYVNIIISSNKFFPNITDVPSPPASFRTPMGWDDFLELKQIHREICREGKHQPIGEEYHVDFALRIHGTSNDSFVGFSRRKEQRDLVEIVVVPLVEATDFRDLSQIEQPLVLLIPFEIFDVYFGSRIAAIKEAESPHTIAEMTQLLNTKK